MLLQTIRKDKKFIFSHQMAMNLHHEFLNDRTTGMNHIPIKVTSCKKMTGIKSNQFWFPDHRVTETIKRPREVHSRKLKNGKLLTLSYEHRDRSFHIESASRLLWISICWDCSMRRDRVWV